MSPVNVARGDLRSRAGRQTPGPHIATRGPHTNARSPRRRSSTRCPPSLRAEAPGLGGRVMFPKAANASLAGDVEDNSPSRRRSRPSRLERGASTHLPMGGRLAVASGWHSSSELWSPVRDRSRGCGGVPAEAGASASRRDRGPCGCVPSPDATSETGRSRASERFIRAADPRSRLPTPGPCHKEGVADGPPERPAVSGRGGRQRRPDGSGAPHTRRLRGRALMQPEHPRRIKEPAGEPACALRHDTRVGRPGT